MALGPQLQYLLPVASQHGGAAARGEGLGSPCWEGVQLLEIMGLQLYMLSSCPLGAGLCNLMLFSGLDWQTFRAGDNSFALAFCVYLLRGKGNSTY